MGLKFSKLSLRMKDMKKTHGPPVFRKPKASDEFHAPACEVCGAPYKLLQALNLRPPKGAPPYGSYVQTCKCERPSPPKIDYGPEVPF